MRGGGGCFPVLLSCFLYVRIVISSILSFGEVDIESERFPLVREHPYTEDTTW